MLKISFKYTLNIFQHMMKILFKNIVNKIIKHVNILKCPEHIFLTIIIMQLTFRAYHLGGRANAGTPWILLGRPCS